MKIIYKAILPLGFKANGISCGLKKSGRLDLALFYSQTPAKAACLFTANKFSAAPVKLNKIFLKRSGGFQAIIANSGNANCFTGVQGLRAAEDTAVFLAKALALKKENILLASTGIIGRKLEIRKIKAGIAELTGGLSREGVARAAKAIMTTDTFTKEVTAKLNINGKPVSICGVAKGAGMIAPDMATMLCFIFTDANIAQPALKKALKIAADNSFNCITVDGCMSTNDSVMLLANGAAENKLIDTGGDFRLFVKALEAVCLALAKMIVRDGEGASKFIRIKVTHAGNFAEAKKAGLALANSNLFKTAVYGENPNFGRIVAALGASGIGANERRLKIKLSSLKKKDVSVEVGLGKGNSACTVYTADLTPRYVKINAEYS
ncbi:MAG: bifunctional glutamate N-acetyltransferase/amino-acid acetyltransferase ArgJ [Candidatus Omnitrophota bacterium]|nr:bifunctional glutamate N-acetyltransferase/amino-acid acetyltransferase ArgJ [Candidatus Omnitrophota bacterium]